MVAPEHVPPQMVLARSLPDGALQGMRQALNALGGGEDEADESEGRLRSRAASTSMVAALDAEELRRETQLWERMMYKSASQHKRAVHFQRMRGVTRHVRAVASLDVGAAAAALRDGLRAGVSDEARAAALESPAVKAGAHAIWKLPRALSGRTSRTVFAPSRGSRRRLTTTCSRRRRRWRANSLTRTSCPSRSSRPPPWRGYGPRCTS